MLMRAAALLLTFSLGLPAAAPRSQAPTGNPTQANVNLDANPTLFAVLAAINVAGYDDGLNAPGTSTIRLDVRSALLAQPLPIVAQLRQFYKDHRLSDPGQNLAQYISLALFIGAPPALRLTVAVQDLPPDAYAISDFLPLLRQFYADENLDALWQRERPQMQAAMDGYSSSIRTALAPVDVLLRLPQSATGRSLDILPEPLVSPAQINARAYRDNYYIVTGLNAGADMEAIRHTYLQFVLDPLVASLPVAVEQIQPVLALAQRAPALDPELKQSGTLFYTECLLRAIEIQLDPGTSAEKRRKVDQAMADGLLITRYWFDTLTDYRKDLVSFREFYPDAAFAIPVPEVVAEGKHTVFTTASVDEQAAPHAIQMESLLQQGEDLLAAHNLNAAEGLANQALLTPNDHASAYYLLALVDTSRNLGALAKVNFTQAIAAATDRDRHVKTWSNIYLGRMSDLAQQRAQAVAYYQAALQTADTEQARTIAREGIEKPFVNPAPPGRGH